MQKSRIRALAAFGASAVLAAAGVAATTAPVEAAAGYAPADTAQIHPGTMMYTDGAQCTANFVYTDGACAGNPGPGGWAWAIDREQYASGSERPSTNQRMEIRAALEAVTTLKGPLVVVSDSTYVVNCFRDQWWAGANENE